MSIRRHHPGMYKDIPGKSTVEIVAFTAGDPQHQMTLPDGTARDAGATLAEWRQRFRGDEGVVTEPLTGRKHHVSLKPWADADPGTTCLFFQFHFIPDQPIAPEFRDRFPPPPWRNKGR